MTHRLPIEKILFDAALLLFREWRSFLRGLAIPGAALVAFDALWWQAGEAETHFSSWMSWGLFAFFWGLVLIFSLRCHRLVLLESQRLSNEFFPPFTWREARFVGRVLLAGLVYSVVYAATTWILEVILVSATSAEFWTNTHYWAQWVGYVIATYVFSRLALMFPATAIDRTMGVLEAWWLGRGNGWRLLLLVGAIPLLIRYGTGWIYSEAPNVAAVVAASVVIALFLAFEVSVLSLSYYELTREQA